MNFVPPTFDPAPGLAEDGTVGRWAALENAARVVATLAGIEPDRVLAETADLPERIGRTEPWRRECAETGIADLSAIMEHGLAALLAVHGRGADPRPAADALWREFAAARGAILALLQAEGR